MTISQFVVDAFTDRQFGGNPAGVCILRRPLPDPLMQNIAAENALAETAFVVLREDEPFGIRWFTPRTEMDLCGHATLAAAHVLWHHLRTEDDVLTFASESGSLKVRREGGAYMMEFPSRPLSPANLPPAIREGLNIQPSKVLESRDYVLVYDDQKEFEGLSPDRGTLDQINLDPGGIAVTAPGEEADFVSRFFVPKDRRLEDPVTGSAHCSLVPYWSDVLEERELVAHQLSERFGVLHCRNGDGRVLIGGEARTYSSGTVFLHGTPEDSPTTI